FGIAGPKGIDPKVVKILHDAFKKGMEDEAFIKALDKLYMQPVYLNTADYTAQVKVLYEEERENAAIVRSTK
ncbi:MAG: hypothetical protein LLG93_16540, partial [Deltaproteobacteria bacterium]|nr:hypothetical protein [Deltaproteobacteria bacterium]